MKKVISISVDGDVLKMGKDAAHELRMSFSHFVEEAIRSKVDVAILGFLKKEPQMGEHDRTDAGPKESPKQTAAERIRLKMDGEVPRETSADREKISEEPDDDMAMLAKKQAELDAEKAKRNIKEEKIKKVRESGFFNPRPKDRLSFKKS